ncbi:TPA: hypothetical protein ACX6RS_000341 [Photobacterium damselae]
MTRLNKLQREKIQSEGFNMKSKHMVLSLNCKDHQHMHGELFSAIELESLYGHDNMSNSCNCTFVLILLDDKGVPYSQGIIKKAKQQLVNKNL